MPTNFICFRPKLLIRPYKKLLRLFKRPFKSRRRRKAAKKIPSNSSTIMELKNLVPLNSPVTPCFINGEDDDHDVKEACRSFEKCIVKMVVEEGKLSDLKDVEELLYCWSKLKSPVFLDLVSGFYGQLCKDLLSGNEQNKLLKDSKDL